MQLRITDGTTTVDLSGATTGIYGCTYFPHPPEGGGGVSESAELVLRGTAAEIRAAVNSVELLLEAARRRQADGAGARIFLEYKPVDTDSLYRSEIYDGRLAWSDEPGLRRFDVTTNHGKAALIVDRAPWWEGPETELQLSSQGNAAATGGRTITNNGVDNWVEIAAAQVTGILPARVRMRLTNNYGSSVDYGEVFVGNNAFAAPATFANAVQAEDAVSGGTPGATAGFYPVAGNNGLSVSVSTTPTQVHWLLPAVSMAAGGRWFRLLLKSAYSGSSVRITPMMYDYSGLVPLWTGGEILLTDGLYMINDLGAVPVPPARYDPSYDRVRLVLSIRASGATTFLMDYLQLVGQDAYRQLHLVASGVANGDAIEVDDIEGRAYTLVSSAKRPVQIPLGWPLVVYPGQTQRWRILTRLATGGSTIGHTLSVQMWARMRRAMI